MINLDPLNVIQSENETPVRGVTNTDRILDFQDIMMDTSPFQTRDLSDYQVNTWIAPDRAAEYTSELAHGTFNVENFIQNFQVINLSKLEIATIPTNGINALEIQHINQCFEQAHQLYNQLGTWSMNHERIFR